MWGAWCCVRPRTHTMLDTSCTPVKETSMVRQALCSNTYCFSLQSPNSMRSGR